MKYLIFGDVHGNLPALEKLLEIEKNNYDFLISHGDVVNYGPWSNECVQLLNQIPAVVLLQGNHEANYLKGVYTGQNEVAQAFFQFCYPQFKEFNIIKKYEREVKVKNFQIRHTINNSYIFPDSDLSLLDLQDNYIIGHSHYQFDRSYKGKRIINTGSVGQNRKIINVAEYIIYDTHKNEIELKSFVFDIELVITEMRSEGYPEICVDYYTKKNKKK